MIENEPSAKVLFHITNQDGSVDSETLWASELGEDRYRLCNSPFFAYSVSWEDIVYAPYDNEDGFPLFERVVEKSGNRTIRLAFTRSEESEIDSTHILQTLVKMGCSYEGATPAYVAINIPPEVILEDIMTFLTKSDVQWEHADPSYDELFPGSD